MTRSRSSRSRRKAGFALLDLVLACGIAAIGITLLFSAATYLQKVFTDAHPRVRAQAVDLDNICAMLARDTKAADASYAFAGSLQLDGSPFTSSTYASDRALWRVNGSSTAMTAFTAGFSLAGKTLTLASPAAGEHATCALLVGSDNRVVAYYTMKVIETSVNGVSGLLSTVDRYANDGTATLKRTNQFQRFTPNSSLASPERGLPLPSFAQDAGGYLIATMPLVYSSSHMLGMQAGSAILEGRYGGPRVLSLRSPYQP